MQVISEGLPGLQYTLRCGDKRSLKDSLDLRVPL